MAMQCQQAPPGVQVSVNLPRVGVHVSTFPRVDVQVLAPRVGVQVSAGVPPVVTVPAPIVAPGVPLPPPPPTPLPAPVAAPGTTALSVSDFVARFRPLPGKYEVTLIHPKTGCPVPVCFTLPGCSCPCRVSCTRLALRFDYGKSQVVLRFRHNGTITVHDRD
jgi:hypothetical protein